MGCKTRRPHAPFVAGDGVLATWRVQTRARCHASASAGVPVAGGNKQCARAPGQIEFWQVGVAYPLRGREHYPETDKEILDELAYSFSQTACGTAIRIESVPSASADYFNAKDSLQFHHARWRRWCAICSRNRMGLRPHRATLLRRSPPLDSLTTPFGPLFGRE